MISLLLFLLVLSVLVLIHEAGHYLAARWAGVKAHEFGYGFPPRAIGFVKTESGWKRVKGSDRREYKNTIWSINWLPLGGFVRLKGEQGENANDPDSFTQASAWRRFVILAAGVTMNWLLAAVIFIVGYTVGVPASLSELPAGAHVRDQRVQIVSVLPGGPADQAGLIPGDFVVVQANQPTLATEWRAFVQERSKKNETVTLTTERDGKQEQKAIQPAYIQQLDGRGIGIAFEDTGVVRFPVLQAVRYGLSTTAHLTGEVVKGFGRMVGRLVSRGEVPKDVSGPVGIAVMTSRLAQQETWDLFQFAAILSINLAVINFLPIPALDGGRVLFLVIERLRRKKASPQIEAWVHSVGFLFLLGLIILVTVKDLRTYGGVIWRGVTSLFS